MMIHWKCLWILLCTSIQILIVNAYPGSRRQKECGTRQIQIHITQFRSLQSGLGFKCTKRDRDNVT